MKVTVIIEIQKFDNTERDCTRYEYSRPADYKVSKISNTAGVYDLYLTNYNIGIIKAANTI